MFALLAEINTLIKNNDLGKEFYKRLLSSEYPIRLLDLDDFKNNDFAVVNELPFSIKEGTEEGSFRLDLNILINGMTLAFLEVKHPDNSGGIQVEFERMINKRLNNDDYKKHFNLIQLISFSNNMEYEDADICLGIPFNIHFIGIMNDVDKGIEAFDLALRRRFKWVAKYCNYDVIQDVLVSEGYPNAGGCSCV